MDADQQERALSRSFSRDIAIKTKNVDILTNGELAHGIVTWHRTEDNRSHGDIRIDVRGGTIATTGLGAFGISSYHQANGNIIIDVRKLMNGEKVTIRTFGASNSYGIVANGQKTCPPEIDAMKCSGIGEGGIRIYGEGLVLETNGIQTNHGVLGWNRNRKGDVSIIMVDNSKITTGGAFSNGIYGIQSDGSNGNVIIFLRNTEIETKSTGEYLNYGSTLARGIMAQILSEGNIMVTTLGGTIETQGTNSHGIYGEHRGTGNISIVAGSNHKITTNGADSHGIYALHTGTDENRMINIVTGNIDARGAGSVGARIGRLAADGSAQFVASIDDDGFRRNFITINGQISAETGIFLAGGGKVNIGTTGSVDARSRIAILATGDNPGNTTTMPKLSVDIVLDERDVVEVIGDGWIINDGGETTIVVNGVLLHDGRTGVITDARAPNGVYDIKIRTDGLMITDRSMDPWTFSPRSNDIIADRDFSADDFIKVIAPRTAVYEILPASLIRLAEGSSCDHNLSTPNQSSEYQTWGQFTGGQGSYQPSSATLGAGFDFTRQELAVGGNSRLTDDIIGCLALRKVSGSVNVFSPMGGGIIEADGYGSEVVFIWEGENNLYGKVNGAATFYSLDISSDNRSNLANDVDGKVLSFGIEAGTRIALDSPLALTAKAWISRTESIFDNEFVDRVESHISFAETSILEAGAGLNFESEIPSGNESMKLYGSVGLRHLMNGNTKVMVNSEEFESEGPKTLPLLDVGISWNRKDLIFDANISTAGIGSDNFTYSGSVGLQYLF